jgi:histidinol-phosphatase (PHP family)
MSGLVDDHVHSTAGSADARDTVHALCARAVEIGLAGLCFTEHLDFNRALPEYGYYAFDRAREAVEAARDRFGDRLEIRMGLEVDFEPGNAAEIAETVPRLPVDFVLGAVHMVGGTHIVKHAEAGRGWPADRLAAFYREYFAAMRALIHCGVADCLAHVDYPAKVGLHAADGWPIDGYDDEMEATLALAVEAGVGVEINAKRVRTGAPFAPPPTALRRFLALGGRHVTLGSDTHSIEQLGDGLALARDLLRDAGAVPVVFRGRRAHWLGESGGKENA